MKNLEVARLFDLKSSGTRTPFRIRAYRRAAQNRETLPEDVEVLAREERLDEVPGIGADLADEPAFRRMVKV